MTLRSPATLRPLRREGHALVCGDERWPVVDDIAFLRLDRRALADAALAALDAGDDTIALVHLLGDQDNWARTPPPDEASRLKAVQHRDTLSFRAAMDLLALGPVATYFAHRWSDPTFLSGLGLAQSYWGAPRRVMELACGAGHYLRAFAPHAPETLGADLVFAKLWLARHFIAPAATLVCFDAAAPWPIETAAIDLLFCHDAFYFMPDKPRVATEMLRVSTRILVGHVHNGRVDNHSAGEAMEPAYYAALFPAPDLFDDRELTAALIEGRTPRPATIDGLETAPAIALAAGTGAPGPAAGRLTAPERGCTLRRNPLYADGHVQWPSSRYASEYGALATYPIQATAPETAIAGESPEVDRLARLRVLLDLPERW